MDEKWRSTTFNTIQTVGFQCGSTEQHIDLSFGFLQAPAQAEEFTTLTALWLNLWSTLALSWYVCLLPNGIHALSDLKVALLGAKSVNPRKLMRKDVSAAESRLFEPRGKKNENCFEK